jgi:hypothetical protein
MDTTQQETKHTALEVLLQWLTYIFWFWTLFFSSLIISSVLGYYIAEESSTEWIVYLAGPQILLYIAALITDKYYKKVETEKKTGFSAVVMVVNAIIAIIISIGSFITASIALTTMLVSVTDTDSSLITFVSSTVIGLLSLLFFLRIIHIKKLALIRKDYSVITGVVVFISIILIAVGPFVATIQRRADRLIEENYYSITGSIRTYVRENNQLPEQFSDVTFEDDAQKAIDTGRVTYKKGSKNSDYYSSSPSYKYELCVDWDKEKNPDYDGYYSRTKSFTTSWHQAGVQCYEEDTY